MNPNYHQQSYSYQQPPTGAPSSQPQPPSWQSNDDRGSGWADPRLHSSVQSPPLPNLAFAPSINVQESHHPPNLPPPPPRPPLPPYDSFQWGVNYNRLQDQNSYIGQGYLEGQRPALPPRPNSSIAHHAVNTSQAAANTWQQPVYAPQQAQTDPWGQSPASQHFSHPPAPLPRPPAYSTVGAPPRNNLPHLEYSHQSSTHRYDPPTVPAGWGAAQVNQPNYTACNVPHNTQPAPTWNYGPPVSDGTISPMEDDGHRFSVSGRSQTVSPVPGQLHSQTQASHTYQPVAEHPGVHVSATALGPGKPSDWQHYHTSDPYEDDTTTETEQTPIATANYQMQLPPSSSGKIYDEPTAVPMESNSSRPGTSTWGQSGPSLGSGDPEAKTGDSGLSSSNVVPRYDSLVQPERTTSTSSVSSRSSLRRTGTIDSVIKAWSTPLKDNRPSVGKLSAPASAASTSTARGTSPIRLETNDEQTQTDFPPIVKTEIKLETVTEVQEVEVSPYADITDHYAATLKRFASMLRQESNAHNDDEKFKIFQGFVIHELRLRSVLYGVEAQKLDSAEGAIESARESTMKTHEVLPDVFTTTSLSKAFTSIAPMMSVPTTSQSSSNKHLPVIPPSEKSSSKQPSFTHQPEDGPRQITPPRTPVTRPTIEIPSSVTPEAKRHVAVDQPALAHEGEYSPGGRPLLRSSQQAPGPEKMNDTIYHPQENTQNIHDSPGANAPMALEDYQMSRQSSPSNNAPIVLQSCEWSPRSSPPISMSANLSGPVNFSPPRPVYTPFRYNEDSVVDISPPKLLTTSENYATVRQAQAAESGRLLVTDHPPMSPTNGQDRSHAKTPSIGRREHEEAFVGLIRQQSKAIRKKPSTLDNLLQLRAGTPTARNTPTSSPLVSPLAQAVQAVQTAVPLDPAAIANKEGSPKLDTIQQSCMGIKDDFSFIHATVLAWDLANRKIRQQFDAERHFRQSENEARVDQLFNDNEIGYADIADLESGFKLDEASRKYQEDKLELESFDKNVSEVVVTRIETELAELTRLQTTAKDVLDLHSSSVSQLVKSEPPMKAPVAGVMNLMLQLFRKGEIRHIKIAEAHFERERRRKMLELSVFFTNGNKAGVKRLEQEYAKAQAIQIFEEAHKKTERMNSIMDSFDRAVVKGLAENQAWVDEILPKLQLLRDLVLGSIENGPKSEDRRQTLLYSEGGVRDLMVRTQVMIDIIIADSQRMVRSSYEAEQLLNEADFGAYLAKEKLAESDPEKLKQLNSDKVKEDMKVQEEFEARLRGVCRDPEEATFLVREVNAQVGTDKEHKSRMGRALDEAKKRNTIGTRPLS